MFKQQNNLSKLDFQQLENFIQQYEQAPQDIKELNIQQESEYMQNKCKSCGLELCMQANVPNIACNFCGLINENTVYVHNYQNNFQGFGFIVKTQEQRDQELNFKILSVSMEVEQLLKKQNIDEQIIKLFLDEAEKIIKYVEIKHENIIKHMYTYNVLQLAQQYQIYIDRQLIYKTLGLNAQRMIRYGKMLQQSLFQFNSLNYDSGNTQGYQSYQNSVYTLLICKLKDFNVSNIIMQFLGVNDQQNNNSYVPKLVNNTNSIILEFVDMQNIKWTNLNVFKYLIDNIQHFKIPKSLLRIYGKYINIDFTKKPILKQFGNVEKSSNMNTAITFLFQSYTDQDKTYKIKLFQKGKLQIPGVLKPYQQSELQNIVIKLKMLIEDIFKTKILSMQNKTILKNFTTKLFYQPNTNIDIVQSKAFIEQQLKQESFKQLQKDFQTNIIKLQIINHRIYIDMQIQKIKMPFQLKNNKSTANIKSGRCIQVIITLKGIVSLQGCDDDDLTTIRIQCFIVEVFNRYMSQFTYNQNIDLSSQQIHYDVQNQQTDIHNHVQVYIQDIKAQETQFIEHLAILCENTHLLANTGIKNRIKLFSFIIKFHRLITNHKQQAVLNKCKHTNGQIKSKSPFCYGCFVDLKKLYCVKYKGVIEFINNVQYFYTNTYNDYTETIKIMCQTFIQKTKLK